jgi:membrane protein implicated in regulation of membrane protease activity
MASWIYWFIAAIVLLFLELVLSGFVLLCFGFAALATVLVCLLRAGAELQMFSFIVFTVVSLVIIRPFVLKHMKPKDGLVETNVYALIGKEALVIEEMNENRTGRVKIGGEEWRAASKDGDPIAAGGRVRVLAVSGNTLIVQRKEECA